jgi:Mce-associated membrane protein
VLTDKSKQSLYDGSRLKVDYRKVDGKWLIDGMKPI